MPCDVPGHLELVVYIKFYHGAGVIFVQANDPSPKLILGQVWELAEAGDYFQWAVWVWPPYLKSQTKALWGSCLGCWVDNWACVLAGACGAFLASSAHSAPLLWAVLWPRS